MVILAQILNLDRQLYSGKIIKLLLYLNANNVCFSSNILYFVPNVQYYFYDYTSTIVQIKESSLTH